jgi:hypothetical protein
VHDGAVKALTVKVLTLEAVTHTPNTIDGAHAFGRLAHRAVTSNDFLEGRRHRQSIAFQGLKKTRYIIKTHLKTPTFAANVKIIKRRLMKEGAQRMSNW